MANVLKARVNLKNVVLSFPVLFKAKSFQDSKEAFSANFLIDKEDYQIEIIKKAIKDLMNTQWTTNPNLKADKIAFKDGDDVTYKGYSNMKYITARNERKPMLKHLDLSNVQEEEGNLQAGDIVNVCVEFWAQDNKYGKRINANLVGVQFVKAGERFASNNNTDDVFVRIADEIDPDNPF